MPVTFQMTGFAAAEAAVRRAVEVAKPGGPLAEGVAYATVEAHRYGQHITHVLTGTLQGAQRMEVSGLRGVIFLEGGAVNPLNFATVGEYGPVEHARGGDHAFYERTVVEAGPGIMDRAIGIVKRGLD